MKFGPETTSRLEKIQARRTALTDLVNELVEAHSYFPDDFFLEWTDGLNKLSATAHNFGWSVSCQSYKEKTVVSPGFWFWSEDIVDTYLVYDKTFYIHIFSNEVNVDKKLSLKYSEPEEAAYLVEQFCAKLGE